MLRIYDTVSKRSATLATHVLVRPGLLLPSMSPSGNLNLAPVPMPTILALP